RNGVTAAQQADNAPCAPLDTLPGAVGEYVHSMDHFHPYVPCFPKGDRMADDIAAAPTAGEDERRLHELGYAQELRRRMSGFSNFAVSFTIISILSGCLTLYGYGMSTGGPAAINIGWPLVGVMVTLVGLAMAEICSSYPTAGGLYYWSAKLARTNGPIWSWYTGWFNLIGQVGITAG